MKPVCDRVRECNVFEAHLLDFLSDFLTKREASSTIPSRGLRVQCRGLHVVVPADSPKAFLGDAGKAVPDGNAISEFVDSSFSHE